MPIKDPVINVCIFISLSLAHVIRVLHALQYQTDGPSGCSLDNIAYVKHILADLHTPRGGMRVLSRPGRMIDLCPA